MWGNDLLSGGETADLRQQSSSRQPPAALAAISLSAAYACLYSLTVLSHLTDHSSPEHGRRGMPLLQGAVPFPQTYTHNLWLYLNILPFMHGGCAYLLLRFYLQNKCYIF